MDVIASLPAPEEKCIPLAPAPITAEPILPGMDDLPFISDAICIPEPMELAMTPPDLTVEDAIPAQPPTVGNIVGDHRSSRSPEKKAEAKKEKKDREKDRDKEPGRKKSRKDSDKEDSRHRMKDSSRPRKGKEQLQQSVISEPDPTKDQSADGDDEVVVVGGRAAPQSRNQPNLREAAKAMPRIPKISQRHSSATGASTPHSRDPRLMMLKPNQGESTYLSFFIFCLFIPGAGHSHNLTKDGHNGLEIIGGGGCGGGKLGSAIASQDDIQVVAAFRTVRNHASRLRNIHNNKRPPSPGIQG